MMSDRLPLNSSEVHIWQANLDIEPQVIPSLEAILSPDERERADRFRFQQHRERFIVGRATLRQLLGDYLNLTPERVRFIYSQWGKPNLAENLGALNFNLSHSHNLAIYAFTHKYDLGIDLEYLRPIKNIAHLAQRFFSASESAVINTLTGEEQQKIFFRGWTAKEAYLKATGDGLGGGLDKFELELKPQEPLRILKINNSVREVANWCLYHFTPASNYVSTVVVKTESQLTFKLWKI